MKNKAKKIILVLMVAVMVLHTMPKPVEVTAVAPVLAWKAAEFVAYAMLAVAGFEIAQIVSDEIAYNFDEESLRVFMQSVVGPPSACATGSCTHVPMCREAYLHSLINAELAQREAQKNLPVDLSPQPGPRPTTRVQTSQGAVDVPIMPVQMSAESLQELVESYSQSIAPILAQQESGHFFDFIEQRFRFFDDFLAELKPPHPLLQGYCSVTGLAITPIEGSLHAPGTEYYDLYTQYAVDTFKDIYGRTITMTFTNRASNRGFDMNFYADGELIGTFSNSSTRVTPRTFVGAVLRSSGLLFNNVRVAVIARDLNGSVQAHDVTSQEVHDILPSYEATPINPPQAQPFPATTQPPNTIAINPAEVNAINNLTALMQSILDIASHPDVAEGALVLNFPVMPERADYPDLTDAQWNKMFKELLDEVTKLTAIVASGASVAEMDLSHVITYDDVLAPPVPATDTNVLDRILGATKESTSVLDKILDAIRTLASAIAIAVVGTMVLDLSPLEDMPSFSGFFPFSIPWDLRNAFIAIFGGTERTAAPVFVLDFSDTILNYRGEISLAQFEPVAQVVRWSLMSFFVLGLIMATGKLIKW